MNVKLTKDGIQEIYKTNVGGNKLPNDVDCTLQILSTKLSETSKDGKSVLTCCLSDSIHKYGGFIFVKDTNNLKAFDIVRLKQLNHQIMSDKVSHAFVVKKYELVNDTQKEMIGKPESYKDPNLSQVSLEEQKTPGRNAYSTGKISTSFNSAEKNYMPLSHLTPYSSNYTIQVRVTRKPQDLKDYTSSRGQGKILNFTVIDKENNEMQITAFNDAAEKFFKDIEQNKVYEIRGGQVRLNDKKYATVKGEYRIILDKNSQVVPSDDNGLIKDIHFNFSSVLDISTLPLNSVVDYIGYVVESSEKGLLKTRNGDMPVKRVKLADMSETLIETTLWRDHSNRDDIKQGNIVAFKSLKIGDYNGRNLNSADYTVIKVDPEIPEADDLRVFYSDYKGNLKTLQNQAQEPSSSKDVIADLKTVLEAFDQFDDKTMPVFRVKAYIVAFKNDERNYYQGCPECKKKVIEDTYGYTCPSETCGKKVDKPTFYYSLSVRIKDHSSEFWVDVFGNLAEKVIKMNCEDYKNLLVEGNENKLNNLIDEIEYQQYYFILKPKVSNYNNMVKKRLSCFRIENVDKIGEVNKLSDEIMAVLNKI